MNIMTFLDYAAGHSNPHDPDYVSQEEIDAFIDSDAEHADQQVDRELNANINFIPSSQGTV